MSKFIKHLPCPKCGSKDNLGEYDDHFFCFGCKYTKLKNDLESIKTRLKARDNIKDPSQVIDITIDSSIPKEAMQWILKYGITQQEITENNIGWNEDGKMLVLLKTPTYWQARTFHNKFRKYDTLGTKPLTIYGQGDTLVCVEDILSAIKIARLSPKFCALPLLGSSLADSWIPELTTRFKSIVIWLDRDKAINAIKIARNLKQRGINSSVVVSPLDPKEYTKGELSEWLKNK